jgi:hypothetical protein
MFKIIKPNSKIKITYDNKVKPLRKTLIIDNIIVKPKENKAKDGFSYTFHTGGYGRGYAYFKVHIHHSLIKNGFVKFPVKGAKAFQDGDDIYIVPCEGYNVHYVLFGSVPLMGIPMGSYLYVDGNNLSVIPFIGYDHSENVHFSGAIITTRKNNELVIEYGVATWDNSYKCGGCEVLRV